MENVYNFSLNVNLLAKNSRSGSVQGAHCHYGISANKG